MTVKHLFPAVEPSLNLDFANSKKLDPRITFTRGSIGTYVGDDGLIKTAAQNEPRFDHDSDGNSLGLLIEESRTNLVDNSIPIDFSLNEWRALNGTNTANSATSPDGSFTAAKFVSTSGQTDIRQYIPQTAVVSGNTYVVSLFVKANPYSYFRIGKTGTSDISGTQSSLFAATFDLNAGTTDGLGFTDSWIEDYGNGWYRCSVAFIANSNTTASIIFYPKNSSYDPLTGDGVSGFYFWGGVIEQGSFPTSYIPTSGSTVTRAADVASISGDNFSSWYRQDEGTVFAEATPRQFAQAFGLISIDDGSTSNRLQTRMSTARTGAFVVSAAGSVQANFATLNDIAMGDKARVATSYALNSFNVSLNGGSVASDTSGTVPTVNQAVIGNAVGAFYSNAPIARLTYYPVRLPDATLQALTL